MNYENYEIILTKNQKTNKTEMKKFNKNIKNINCLLWKFNVLGKKKQIMKIISNN